MRWLARRPDEQKAKELFDQGMSLVDIARELGVSGGTVRSWKSRYNWGGGKTATLQKEKCNVAKKKVQRCNSKNNIAEKDKRTVELVLENQELTAEQQLFCVLYAKRPNATQAYKKAYGCSYDTANAHAYKLLSNVVINAENKHLRKEHFENQLFNEHDVFQWYLDIATACITDYVTFGREEVPVMNMFGPVMVDDVPLTKEVNYVKFQESIEVDGRAIKKIKMGKEGASIELYDAMKAMDWLAEHMSMGTAGQQGLAMNILSAYELRKCKIEKEGSLNDEQ